MVGAGRRRAPASWWASRRRLPTTLAGVELCLVYIMLALRVTNLGQLAVGAPEGLSLSTNPGLDAAMMATFLFESVWFITVVGRRRRYRSTGVATVDTTMAAAVTVTQAWFSAPAERVGTWTAWGFPVGIAAAVCAGVGFRSYRAVVVAVAVLVAAYVAVSLPVALQFRSAGTVLSNALGLLACGFFGRLLAGYLRRLGHDADSARALAAQAAEQAAVDRQRRLLHDQSAVLSLLSDPDPDPGLAPFLREQAAAGANRIRQFLGAAAQLSTRQLTLVNAIRGAIEPFGDLPIVATLDLADGVRVTAELEEAVSATVTTLLHNVRRHAHAREVVIHADADRSGGWEFSVRDDGVGFKHDWETDGFGLRQQVRQVLRSFGADVSVDSARGEGTCVTVRWPAPS